MRMTPKCFCAPVRYADTTVHNLWTPCDGKAYLFDFVKYINIANVHTSVAKSISIWVGATGGSAAGTEVLKEVSIPAMSVLRLFCCMCLSSTQFMTMKCTDSGGYLRTSVYGDRGVAE
jgi:hypothetical protein